MITYKFRGESQEFLPRCALDQITTWDVISLVAQEDKELYLKGKEMEEFVNQVYRKAPKLFATCVFDELSMNYLKGLLDDNLSDANFPLTESTCSEPKVKRRLRRVMSNQKKFFVPYLSTNSMQNLDDITKPIKFDEDEDFLLGTGAFGEVYEIEIHPDHRSFSCVSTL